MNFFPLRNSLDFNACLYSFCDDMNRFAQKCPWKFTLNVLVSEPVERVESLLSQSHLLTSDGAVSNLSFPWDKFLLFLDRRGCDIP